MQDPTTLDMEATADVALKDTQEDEYYENVTPAGVRKTFEQLRENPYPGLRPFKTSEANVFFGRKDITFDLISRLATHRFLAVLGASGSGKSSLVRAGLLPGLKTLPGKHSLWKVAICRPGKNPFGNLAIAIGKAGIAPEYSNLAIWKSISSSSYGFEELYQSLKTPSEYNTLIVIDQFEELFRFKKDNGTSGKNDAALFVKMLIDISKIETLNTYVMITMRSEYLGDCVQFPDLVEEINSGQFLVPRLKINQLRDAIMEPAGFANASVEPVCANRLVGEIGDNMDQLPVLQHALRRSFDEAKKHEQERKGITLSYADYTTIGRMERALNNHAEEIMESLTDSQKKYCRILFQSITDRATDGRGIRRPLSFATIFKICIEAKTPQENEQQIETDLRTVINSFRKDSVNFLMPPDNVPVQANTEIDISHESLMRTWVQLIGWIEREARDADLLKILLAKEESEYITGGRLLSFQEWVAAKRNAFTWAGIYKPASVTGDAFTRTFTSRIGLIDKSVDKFRDDQLKLEQEQEEKLEEQRQKAKRRLIWIVLIGLVCLIAVVSAVLLARFNSQLNASKKTVETQNADLQKSKDLLDKQLKRGEALNDSLQRNSIQLAENIRLLETNKQKLLAQNERIARDSATLQRTNLVLQNTVDQLREGRAALNNANDSLLASTKKLEATTKTAENLQNLAVAVKHAEKSLSIPEYDEARRDIKTQLALVSYKMLKESGDSELTKLQPQIYTGLYNAIKGTPAAPQQQLQIKMDLPGADRLLFARAPAGSGHAHIIYLTADDRNLYSYNLSTNQQENKPIYKNKNLISIDASKQGKWLALNMLSNRLLLRNLQTAVPADTVLNFNGTVRVSRFSPDGNTLFVFTKDSVLHRIDMNNLKNSISHASSKLKFMIEDLAVSKNILYALTADGTVQKWMISDQYFTKPSGITIPKNLNNYAAKGYMPFDQKELPSISKKYRGTRIACNEDNSLVVWGNEGGEVFYYEPASAVKYGGYNLARFGGPVTDIAFSESGKYLAISSFDRSIKVFQISRLQAEAPMELKDTEGSVTAIFFAEGSSHQQVENLYAVTNSGNIRIYPMDLQLLACTLENTSNVKPGPAEQLLYFDSLARKKINELACKK